MLPTDFNSRYDHTELLDGVFLVTEEEIISSMRFLWERMKLVVEPSGAVAVRG